jgi:hypothetical protein
MALVKSKTLFFPASGSTDVVKYKLYVEPTVQPARLSYQSMSFDLGMPQAGADGRLAVDLGGFDVLRTIDGTYDIGVVAVDDAGNESTMSVLSGVALDFTAPGAPGALEIL